MNINIFYKIKLISLALFQSLSLYAAWLVYSLSPKKLISNILLPPFSIPGAYLSIIAKENKHKSDIHMHILKSASAR